MTVEETRRRNEASMARKRAANATSPTTGISTPESPLSPSAGAMDSLLEKLRAAAPQTRDQRDRRRRARLKDRHQDRIASGQKIPELTDLAKPSEESGSISPGLQNPALPGGENPEKENLSEGEEVADRAASLLQGLRGDGDPEAEGTKRDSSLRVRRRRENADEERRNRRRRRTAAATAANSEDTVVQSPTIDGVPGENEEGTSVGDGASGERKGAAATDDANGGSPPITPVTTVSPPTPERGTEARPLEISD